ncbi:hypothetical protein SynA1840_02648 [Synechococcus sp. A18-40]|nr:hypothetical protein SynA1840_02648 [Synechococcus sp. A18-40]
MTKASADSVDGCTDECFRRPHVRLEYNETLADPPGELS